VSEGQVASIVRLETAAIVDHETFHDVCAATFGFPAFYGRNMDAWIGCLTYLDDGMSRFDLPRGEVLTIEVIDFEALRSRAPEVAKDLVECAGFVNERAAEMGDPPRLKLVLL
jgi:RNAse (barnase) inhibitor barstar